MESKPNLENTIPVRTIEEVEAMILAIDQQIVDGVTREQESDLLKRKIFLAKEAARLKGEPITDGTTTLE